MTADIVTKEEVIRLFQKYGFEHRVRFSGNGFEAFTYRTGFFYNAELVSVSCWEKVDEASRDDALEQLKTLKFSTKIKDYQSVGEIEEDLFTGFFDVKNWKKKIENEYDKHCERCLSAFPSDNLTYSYISGSFVKNSEKSDKNLIETVTEGISENGAKLIIVEAPAGYGKTCASYEIVKSISDQDNEQIIPFFAEFSRDRQARVFSHILTREVDRSFTSVRSDVVIDEIKSGKVIVVLDGFDELLQDQPDKEKSNFEAAEQMLETISELLEGDAKVILTSRRSAIFDGEAFNDWMVSHETSFTIERYRLEKPTLEDWLPWGRIKELENRGIDLTKIANPVLLGYLSSLNDNDFSELLDDADSIVNYYFTAMMERENDRQNLSMNPEEQLMVLKHIANDMSQKNYTSDSKESLVKLILDSNLHTLQDVRKRHAVVDRPTTERLATTLSNHAFLDRCDEGGNIQFVNEFALGYFLAACAISDGDWMAHDERFVEPPVLSYVSMPKTNRVELWDSLQTMLGFVTKSDRARYEFQLLRKFRGSNYVGEEIRKVDFNEILLTKDEDLKNIVFTECIFKRVKIDTDKCDDVTFLNCEFWDSDIFGLASDDQVHFYACGGNNEIVSSWNEVNDEPKIPTGQAEEFSEIEKFVLMKFFQSSSMNIERLQVFTGTLFKDTEYQRKAILKSMRSLRQSGFIVPANDHSFIALNRDFIPEIKALLSKNNER